MFILVLVFLLTFCLCFLVTFLTKRLALKLQILDRPWLAPHRKTQKAPIPLLGGSGFALVSSFLCLCAYYLPAFLASFSKKADFYLVWLDWQNSLSLYFNFDLFWIILAGVLLLVIGYFDDRWQTAPFIHLSLILLILTIPISFGQLSLQSFSYPLDGLFTYISNPLVRAVIAPSLAYIWLVSCTLATKFLDGHDGLVTSVGLLAFLAIASVSLLPNVNQPLLAIFCLFWFLGLVSFLFFNFPEAEIYLGEGGSLVIGYTIGALSIIAGAKVATAGMVIGWFIVDFLLVIFTRLLLGQKPWVGDNKLHWHHRLKALGLNKIQVLVLTVGILLVTIHFGLSLGTVYKAWILVLQACFLFLVFLFSFWIPFFNQKINLLKF